MYSLKISLIKATSVLHVFSLGILWKDVPKVFLIRGKKHDPYADKYSLLWKPVLLPDPKWLKI